MSNDYADYEAELANLGGSAEANAGIDLSNLDLPTLSLTDDDLDTSSGSSEYLTIPQWTDLEVLIYDVEVKSAKSSGNLQWRVTFQTVEDTWGPKKQMNTTITFSPKNPFIWGPFLKAVGLVKSGGQVGPDTFGRVNEIKGQIICAKVQGHSWKDPKTGDYLRSYGKKDQRAKYPSQAEIAQHGIRLYEELGGFSAYEPQAADRREDAEESLDSLAQFSGDDYL